jgi:hypothetical protein
MQFLLSLDTYYTRSVKDRAVFKVLGTRSILHILAFGWISHTPIVYSLSLMATADTVSEIYIGYLSLISSWGNSSYTLGPAADILGNLPPFFSGIRELCPRPNESCLSLLISCFICPKLLRLEDMDLLHGNLPRADQVAYHVCLHLYRPCKLSPCHEFPKKSTIYSATD